MGTRADFFIGIGPTATWIGSTTYDGHPTYLGAEPLKATSEAEFRAAVERMLEPDPDRETTRPEEGWPWPWNDFRGSDYAYAWDPARGAVVTHGRAWVTRAQLEADPDCIYAGADLRDDEVPDMRRVPKGDVLGKSGLLLLKLL